MKFCAGILLASLFFGPPIFGDASVNDDHGNRDTYIDNIKHLLMIIDDDTPEIKESIIEEYNSLRESYGLDPLSVDMLDHREFHLIPLHIAHLRLEETEKSLSSFSYQTIAQKLSSLLDKLSPFINIAFEYAYGTILSREILLHDREIWPDLSDRFDIQNLNDEEKGYYEDLLKMECVDAYNSLRTLVGQSPASSFQELDISWINLILEYVLEKRLDDCIKRLTGEQRKEVLEFALGLQQKGHFAHAFAQYTDSIIDIKQFVAGLTSDNVCMLDAFAEVPSKTGIIQIIQNFLAQKLKSIRDIFINYQVDESQIIHLANHIERLQIEYSTLMLKDEL